MSSLTTSNPRIKNWLFLITILILGTAVRIIALDKVPPGLAPDEATNGYDAYSLLLTGRDQHGVFLPLVMQSFNDYRMPLFTYSIIPFIELFGLTVISVRLTAATWGILTIPTTYWLGCRMQNPRTGLVAALFLALSAWHLPFSRMGLEISLITFTFTLSMALLWEWHARKQDCWLIAAAIVLGLAIYTYSTAKLLVPAFLGLVGLCWFKEWRNHRRVVITALVLILIIAIPMIYLTIQYNAPMQARYNQLAIFRTDRPWQESLQEVTKSFMAHFSPSYLFIRGDLDNLQHPPFGGQLYWVQAPLLFLGLWAIRKKENRPVLLFLLGWLLLAAIPSALTKPNIPGSPHSSRNLIAVVPFQLLTGIAINWLWNNNTIKKTLKILIVVVMSLSLSINAIWYLHQYFFNYAAQVAYRFDDGMQATIDVMDSLDDTTPIVVFSNRISWPYIYVLFFTQYDPAKLHTDPPVRGNEIFAPVTKMGKYIVVDNLDQAYTEIDHGLFIGPPDILPGIPAVILIDRPANGEPFCKIVTK